jgi:hypothetical protein
MAELVYGVVPGEDATRGLRVELLAARLASAVPPAVAPATVPEDVPLRRLAGELAVVERDGRPEAFVSVTGRVVLAPAGGNFKDGCAVLERPLHDVAPEFATREGRAGHRTRYREYLCPVTGLRVDSEILKEGDEALHDVEILGGWERGARGRDPLVAVAAAAAVRAPGVYARGRSRKTSRAADDGDTRLTEDPVE